MEGERNVERERVRRRETDRETERERGREERRARKRKRVRARAVGRLRESKMQHLQQSTSFHYTPAEIYCLPSQGGRETQSETEGERARCSICNNLGHSITLLPRSIIYHLMQGGRWRGRQREETKSETEGERARCSICNNLRHSITLLPRSIVYLLREGGRKGAR